MYRAVPCCSVAFPTSSVSCSDRRDALFIILYASKKRLIASYGMSAGVLRGATCLLKQLGLLDLQGLVPMASSYTLRVQRHRCRPGPSHSPSTWSSPACCRRRRTG